MRVARDSTYLETAFDRVFGAEASQREVYESVKARQLLSESCDVTGAPPVRLPRALRRRKVRPIVRSPSSSSRAAWTLRWAGSTTPCLHTARPALARRLQSLAPSTRAITGSWPAPLAPTPA